MNKSILELLLGCRRSVSETRLAELLIFIEYAVNDLFLIDLDCLVKSLLPGHVLKDIGLEVAINDKNCKPGNVLEGFLECLEYLLQTFERVLGIENMLDILVDLLNSFDVNLVSWSTLLLIIGCE